MGLWRETNVALAIPLIESLRARCTLGEEFEGCTRSIKSVLVHLGTHPSCKKCIIVRRPKVAIASEGRSQPEAASSLGGSGKNFDTNLLYARIG